MFKLYILFLLHVFAHRTRQSNLRPYTTRYKTGKMSFCLVVVYFSHFLAFYLLNESCITTTCTKRVHFSPKRGLKWEINESINATKHIPEDFRQTGWCNDNRMSDSCVLLKVVHFNLTSNVRSSIHQKVVCFIFILTITRITFSCVLLPEISVSLESRKFSVQKFINSVIDCYTQHNNFTFFHFI